MIRSLTLAACAVLAVSVLTLALCPRSGEAPAISDPGADAGPGIASSTPAIPAAGSNPTTRPSTAGRPEPRPEPAGDRRVPETGPRGPLEAWHDSAWDGLVHSPDAVSRARGIELMPRRREDHVLSILERVLDEESDLDVLERALFAWSEILGREAVGRLRAVALDEGRELRTREAALAALDLVETIDPAEPRGEVSIAVPGPVEAGAPFEVVVRVAARADASRAALRLVLSRGLEVDGGSDPAWEGSLAAGQERELRFRLRLVGPAADARRIRSSLTLDFADRLDVEVRDASLLVRAGAAPVTAPRRERRIELAADR